MEFIPIIIVIGILLSEALKRNQNNKSIIWLKLKDAFGLDLKALALFRIALGLTIIYDLVTRMVDISEHYSDSGVLPRSVLENTFPYNSFPYIYMITGSNVGVFIVFIVNIILAICLIFGLYTRFITPLLWYFNVSLHYRNMLVCFGGDIFLHTLLFWGMFLPLGNIWSIDNLLLRNEDKDKDSNKIFSFGSIAYTLQIIVLYVISTEHKYSPEWRTEGSAIYYSLSYDLYLRPLGKFIYDLRLDGVLRMLTFFVYWLERIGPFLLISPIYTNLARLFVVVSFILMHIGINSCMNVGYFGLVSCVAMIPFISECYINKASVFFNKFDFKYFKELSSSIKSKYGRTPQANDFIPIEFKNVFILLSFIYIFTINLANINPNKYKIPKEASNVAKLFFLDQKWSMFIPSTLKSNWWLLMPAKLKDGTVIDLFTEKTKLDWDKPVLILKKFKSYRKSVYLNNLLAYGNDWHRNLSNYGDYLCRSWDATHDKNKSLEEFDVYYIFEENFKNYVNGPPQKRLVWKQFCTLSKNEQEKIWSSINSDVDLTSDNCNLDDAVLQLRVNLGFLSKRFGENDPVNIQSLLKLAECYRALKRYKESEELYKKLIYISETAFGENQVFTYTLYYYLSTVLLEENKIQEHDEVLKLANESLKRISGNQYSDYAALSNLYRDKVLSKSCRDKYNK